MAALLQWDPWHSSDSGVVWKTRRCFGSWKARQWRESRFNTHDNLQHMTVSGMARIGLDAEATLWRREEPRLRVEGSAVIII